MTRFAVCTVQCSLCSFSHVRFRVGTELENKTIAQTVIETAGDPNRVLTYNYASEALNNSFFLNSFVRGIR